LFEQGLVALAHDRAALGFHSLGPGQKWEENGQGSEGKLHFDLCGIQKAGGQG
jgi:hypothetical protein